MPNETQPELAKPMGYVTREDARNLEAGMADCMLMMCEKTGRFDRPVYSRPEAPRLDLQLPELNDDLRDILGRICHTCIAISQVLRLMGHEIKKRAEDEQAATIHWLLSHYVRDQINWRANASNELRIAAEKYRAANAADQGEVGTYLHCHGDHS